jgi:hypothetical protein
MFTVRQKPGKDFVSLAQLPTVQTEQLNGAGGEIALGALGALFVLGDLLIFLFPSYIE